jgi:site-specific DNA-methyltransferase (adenine-specific)
MFQQEGPFADLVIGDPPFAIKFTGTPSNYNRKAENVIKAYIEISKEKYLQFSRNWIRQAYRILNPHGSMYVFSGWSNLKDVLIALDEAGFITINHIIYKYQFGVYTTRRYVTSHYHLLFVVKNAKKYYFNKIDHYPEDVWIFKRPYAKGKIKAPNKLPSELIRKILLYSSWPGSVIYDPFCGNGTVPLGVLALNEESNGEEPRSFVATEESRPLYEFVNQKIEAKMSE